MYAYMYMYLQPFPVSTVHKLAVRISQRLPQQEAAVPTVHATEALAQVLGSHRWNSFQTLAREACTRMKLLLELQVDQHHQEVPDGQGQDVISMDVTRVTSQ